MTSNDDQVRLSALLRSTLHALPQGFSIGRGLWNLLSVSLTSRASIGLRLELLARKQPRNTALLFEDRRWTYAEFNAWANRCAAALRAQGVGRGQVVGILMENRPEVLACVAACVKLGGIAAMLNHNQRGEALQQAIKLANPRVLVIGSECREAIESTELKPAVKPDPQHACTYFWDGDGIVPRGYRRLSNDIAQQSDANPPETVQLLASDAAFHIYTSGTTGMPKASVMTHYRWLKGMAGLGQAALRLQADDVLYCPLPLYHNNALTVSWGAVLGAGAAFALGRKFSASRFWDEIRRYDATAFCYIGELCRYLLNRPESPSDREHRVRLAVGNGLRPELWDRFQQRFGIARICEFYAASESNLAFVNTFDIARTAGFCPLPFAIVEFDADSEQPLRGADGLMRKVAAGGVGLLITEIGKRTPFDGYTDAKASAAKQLHDVFKRGDLWFNTGDLVRDQGWRHIQFVDRIGDTFRWKGENVATTEVEAALDAFPHVEQAVVYGVQVPAADGRAGMAALSWRDGAFDGAALAQHLQKLLPAYAVPLFIRLRAQQELTGTFKYRKVELKREGFDPARIDEPLYLLRDPARGYEPLTAALYSALYEPPP
ncbi:MAG: long-chain-acyl-CoA synthetase [Nevskia sp.]|nr:long-chain-acyl-CoA synthetase [Nevskia sp.]